MLNRRQADYDYFFSRLKTPDWIMPLKAAGMFSDPFPPEKEGKYISFPRWPESEYLARMAKQAPETVLEVMLQIPDTENIRVNEDFVNAALAMPAELTAKLIDKAKKWAESYYHPLFPEKLGSLIAHLARGGQIEEALSLARVLFAVLPDPTRLAEDDEDDIFRFSPTPRGRFDTWDYRIALKESLPALVEVAGERALRLFCDLLEEAMRLSRNRSEGTGPQDHSYIWRRNIDSGSVDGDVRDALITAVRKAAEQIAATGGQEVRKVVEMLEACPWFIFHRIALYILRLFPDAVMDLIVEKLTDASLFGVPELWHEFFLLAREHFAELRPDQQNVFLNWVETGPAPGTFEKDEDRRFWRLRRLAPIRDVLPAHWRARYEELVAEFGEVEWPEYVSPPSSIRWGYESPKSSEEIRQMSFEEILTFLKEWQPSASPIGPTPEGLGQQLTAVVSSEPERFADEVESLKGVDPTYVRAVLSGLHEALRQQGTVAWPPVLRLCKWVIEQPQEANKAKGTNTERDPDWNWTKSSIENLLEEGLKSESQGIPSELHQSVWEVLLPLTEDPHPAPEHEAKSDGSNMDPLTHSLNTIRGQAMHCVMRYALWRRRHIGSADDTQSFNAMPEVRKVLDKHLEPDHDSSLAIRAVYGQWLPWLTQLDSEWTASRLQKIFPSEKQYRDLLDAAWDTYVIFNQPYNNIFKILREEYRRAIDRIGTTSGKKSYSNDPDDRLAEHLMILYARGQIGFDDKDGLFAHFWKKAPGDVRGHAIWVVGRDFNEIDEEIPSEVLERLKALWSERINEARDAESKAPYTSELSAFGGWFASTKFDDQWAITQLRDALKLVGSTEPYHRVLERLATLALSMPAIAVECLGLMVEGDKKRRYAYSWHEHMRAILEAALDSEDTTTQRSARALIDRLLARDRTYAGFRDLLQRNQT